MVSVVMHFLKVFLYITLITLNTAHAMEYTGEIFETKQKALALKEDSSGKNFNLTFENENVEKLLQKLKANDYISFQGARSSNVNSIRVDSINFVGLKDLIAVWKGDDRYCYSFINFTEFIIYPIRNGTCGKPPKLGKKYAYTINPTELTNWVLLLSSDQANYVADLVIKSNNLIEISLYDSNTGYILKVIKLRK